MWHQDPFKGRLLILGEHPIRTVEVEKAEIGPCILGQRLGCLCIRIARRLGIYRLFGDVHPIVEVGVERKGPACKTSHPHRQTEEHSHAKAHKGVP